VHLGQSDLRVQDVRRLAGDALLVGVSTHDLAEAHAAAQAGADYCGVGAMFPTTTKERPTSGLPYLRAYLADEACSRLPHLAIGGISPSNAHHLAQAGCKGVAVSASVCGADDPADACRRLLAALATPVNSPHPVSPLLPQERSSPCPFPLTKPRSQTA
jgi:thiamine-phosphate pyrophosphorylase